MVLVFKRRAFKNKRGAKIRYGYLCLMGCGAEFKRRRDLEAHQGEYWPGCPPLDHIGHMDK